MKRKDDFQNPIIANNVGFVDLNQKATKKRNPFFVIFPIMIFLIFSGICFGGYYYYKNYMVESTQSIFFNYAQKIDFNSIFEDVLYSQIAQKNNTTVHNTKATLSVKSKSNRDDSENPQNKIAYNFDIFSNPQSDEKSVKLNMEYSDNNLFEIEGFEKDKYMAVYCPDILEDYVAWEKENTSYFMSKISNNRNKFNYNEIFELFSYPRTDFDSQFKSDLFNKLIKVISKNTKKEDFEQKPNVSFTDRDGKYNEAVGYKLHLTGEETNKIYYELIKAVGEDKELLGYITQEGEEVVSSTEIDTSNVVYKIFEAIMIEKKLGISSAKLESILDSKLIEIENNSQKRETTTSLYIVEDKVKIIIFDNNKDYLKCEYMDDNSVILTYLADDMPNYIDGTIKDVKANIADGMAFLDKALEGDYIAPPEVEEEAENHDVQQGTLKSITVVGNDQNEQNNQNEQQDSTQSNQEAESTTNSEQDVENTINVSEQITQNNSNIPNNTTTSLNAGDGGTVRIGEQGDVTYRNAPQEIDTTNNTTLSREDIIEDSEVGRVEFSSNDDSDEDDGLREELHDIDNTVEEIGENLTDTSLYSNDESEFDANSSQTNGFTLIIKKSDGVLDIEYDEIRKSQILSKYIIQMNIDGTEESTEVKNDIAINYYDSTSQKLINLKYSTKYGENTVQLPDIENNAVILDEMEEEKFDETIEQIRGFVLKYIKLKKNQWNLITSRNG